MPNEPNSLRIVRSAEVTKLTGIGESQRHRLMAVDQFPRPIKITDKSVGWIEGEINAWIQGRIALRDELAAREANLPPAERHRLRAQRAAEADALA